MPGANKVAVKQGLNWEQRFSELFNTSLDLGSKYVEGLISEQTGAASTERMEKAAQIETSLAATRAKTLVWVAGGLLLALIAFKTFKKVV